MPGNHAVTQYTVMTRNGPGQLRRLAQALAKEDVNVLGLTGETLGHSAVMRFIADKNPAVKKALDELGLQAAQESVFRVALPNKPGALAHMTKLLEDAGVGIDTIYGTADEGDRCRLVLSVDKPEKAEKVLAAFADTLVLATH